MTYHTFIEGLRLADAIMASLVVCVLFYRAKMFWDRYTAPQRWMMVSYMLYVTAIAYTSFELYAQDVSVGYRSYIVFVANIVAIYALARHPESIIVGDRQHKRKSSLR